MSLKYFFECVVGLGGLYFGHRTAQDKYYLPLFRLLFSLCPKRPSARGLVASLPVRLLFKSI